MSTIEEKLLDACQHGDLPLIREIVEGEAVNVNEVRETRRNHHCQDRSTDGWTPLHYASL